jgi:hypothetical protein
MATEQIVPLSENGVTVKELEDSVRQLQRIVQIQDNLITELQLDIQNLEQEVANL